MAIPCESLLACLVDVLVSRFHISLQLLTLHLSRVQHLDTAAVGDDHTSFGRGMVEGTHPKHLDVDLTGAVKDACVRKGQGTRIPLRSSSLTIHLNRMWYRNRELDGCSRKKTDPAAMVTRRRHTVLGCGRPGLPMLYDV